jgi:hypothetical protein
MKGIFRLAPRVRLNSRESFIRAATEAGLNYAGHDSDPLFTQPRNKALRAKARRLKDLWRRHSSQSSLSRLTYVHWFNHAVSDVPEFVLSSGKDEISTSISLAEQPIERTGWGAIGVLLQGWVTFAGNNMNQMMTGYFRKIKAKDRAKYGRAGLPKRPIETTPQAWGSFVLEAGDLEIEEGLVNEAILDNWTPVAWVVTDGIQYMFEQYRRRSEREDLRAMIEAIRKTGLPVINLNRELVGVEFLDRAFAASE